MGPVSRIEVEEAAMYFDERYYRRRMAEELAAASRAVTSAARLRRQQLADAFSQQLENRGCQSNSDENPTVRRDDWDNW